MTGSSEDDEEQEEDDAEDTPKPSNLRQTAEDTQAPLEGRLYAEPL